MKFKFINRLLNQPKSSQASGASRLRARFGSTSVSLKRIIAHRWQSVQSAKRLAQTSLPLHLRSLRSSLQNVKAYDFKKLKDLRPDEIFQRLQSFALIPNAATYARLAMIGIAAYFLADTFSLFADYFVPDPPLVPPPPAITLQNKVNADVVASTDAIVKRNIFNSRGLIPDEQFIAGIPRKTNLPLTLVGSMVFENELNSIATIEDKSQNKTFPVQVDDVINASLRITRIEERRVYFNNLNTGAFEYVEMVEEYAGVDIEAMPVSGIKKDGGITQTAPNQYEIERGVIDKSMSNLPELLRQARAVPNFENGVPNGYRIMDIAPGSFFEQLGIRPNDVITAFNGDAVNDPGKALQLLNEIRNTDHATLTIKRNGQTVNTNVVVR